MDIYEKIKVMRMFKGLTQEDIAGRLEMSVSGYAKIEHGETDVSLSKLEKIAEVMEIELQQLFGLTDKNILNVIDSVNNLSQHGNIHLTESQCAHQLEKTDDSAATS